MEGDSVPDTSPVKFFIRNDLMKGPGLRPLSPGGEGRFRLGCKECRGKFAIRFSRVTFHSAYRVRFFRAFLSRRMVAISNDIVNSKGPRGKGFVKTISAIIFLFGVVILYLDSLIPLTILLCVRSELSE